MDTVSIAALVLSAVVAVERLVTHLPVLKQLHCASACCDMDLAGQMTPRAQSVVTRVERVVNDVVNDVAPQWVAPLQMAETIAGLPTAPQPPPPPPPSTSSASLGQVSVTLLPTDPKTH